MAEFGTVYRWEQSGELNGMTRVRGFTQDDAHLFIREDQLQEEIRMPRLGQISLLCFRYERLSRTVSLRTPIRQIYGKSESLNKAESALRDAVKNLGVEFEEELGEAAFYGPKIDFVVKDDRKRMAIRYCTS